MMSQIALGMFLLVAVAPASSSDVYKPTGKVVLYNRGDSNWEIKNESGAPFINQMSCEEYACEAGFDCTKPTRWKCTLNTAAYRQQTEHVCESSCPSSLLSRMCTKSCSAKTTVHEDEVSAGAGLCGLLMFVFLFIMVLSCLCGDDYNHHHASSSDFVVGWIVADALFGGGSVFGGGGSSDSGGNSVSWS